VPQKKIAGFYNLLGDALIIFEEKKYYDSEVENFFQKILNTKASNLLDFAEALFVRSVSLSRNSDFTKADAYDGLYRIYKYKLDHYKLSEEVRTELISAMNNYKNKREAINASLNRQT
jgi:hypothetical protein